MSVDIEAKSNESSKNEFLPVRSGGFLNKDKAFKLANAWAYQTSWLQQPKCEQMLPELYNTLRKIHCTGIFKNKKACSFRLNERLDRLFEKGVINEKTGI